MGLNRLSAEAGNAADSQMTTLQDFPQTVDRPSMSVIRDRRGLRYLDSCTSLVIRGYWISQPQGLKHLSFRFLTNICAPLCLIRPFLHFYHFINVVNVPVAGEPF
jgi:hypothetical protein